MLNFFSAAQATNTAVNASASPLADFKSSSLMSFLPIGIVFAIFYFLMIRPQQKKMRDHKIMVDAIKVGDSVLTAGGITGVVAKVLNANEIKVTIAPGVDVVVVRSSLSQVLTKESGGIKNNTSQVIDAPAVQSVENRGHDVTSTVSSAEINAGDNSRPKKLTASAKTHAKTPVLMPSQMRAKKTLKKTK